MSSRALVFLLLLLPALAGAQTACTFSSNPGMAFGVYDDSSASNTDSASSIVVSCARNGGPASADITLALGPSANSGVVNPSRQLRSGANLMNYNLYRDSGRSAVWGQTAGVDTLTININGIPNNGSRNATFVVYGRIPAQQSVGAGGYSDSVQMTVMP